jgi:CRISPR system Cascade subunit CasC
MTKFIQLHILTSYPPANLNRDDLGRPKTAKMGGVDRLRISSQSLKRAWRTSDLFKSALDGHIGVRTKKLGLDIYNRLLAGAVKPKDARTWAKAIAGVFGASKKEDKKNPESLIDLEIEQLAHVSVEERHAAEALADKLIEDNRAPSGDELKLLRKQHSAVDIAMFGRMLASSPTYNVEAACQVSHAISVHPVVIEDDYFTAVDDLNTGEDDMGAAHIGESGFAAALFYTYICIDKELLLHNLGKDIALTNKAISALLEAAVKVAPGGKQNSFASRAWASYVLAEKGDDQPRSLSVAFLKPITGSNYGEDSIKALKSSLENIEKVYEIETPIQKEFNTLSGEGTFSELIAFVQE